MSISVGPRVPGVLEVAHDWVELVREEAFSR